MFSPILAQSISGFSFSTFNAVIYTVSFLVPGFLMDLIASRLFYKKSEQVPITLLKFLTFSCLNYAVWIPICFLIWNKQILENPRVFSGDPLFFLVSEDPWFFVGAFLLVIFISPLLLGLALGYINQKQLIEGGLSTLGFKPLAGFPSAWDYKFSRVDSAWILVTLKDGSRIAGKFAANSFTSSPDHDLYIEEVYRIIEDEPWQPVSQTSGIWVRGEEICYIEFWNDQIEES